MSILPARLGARRRVLATAAVFAALAVALQGQSRQVVPGPMPNLPYSAAVRADGLVYAAGSVSEEGGDIRAQTKVALESLGKTLERAGSSLANAAAVHVYLADAADYAAMNEVYATFWPKAPPVRTTTIVGLTLAGSRIEITAVAVPKGAERNVILPEGWVPPAGPYSYGIQSGDTVFLAGLVSRNGRDNAFVPGDMATQTKTVLDNARTLVEAAGLTLADVVSSRVSIADGSAFQAMNEAYQPYFASAPPARATIVAGLPGPDYQVEITLTAVRGPKRVVTTPNADGSPGRSSRLLSSAIAVGNRLYLSGILGTTAETRGAAGKQAAESLTRIGRTLTAAGFDWSHVVDSVVYITDLDNYDAMNGAYRPVFTSEAPARATVTTGLVSPQGLVEIMMVAVRN